MAKHRLAKILLRRSKSIYSEILKLRVKHKTLCNLCCCSKVENIPRDVPKGHLVVYVGERFKRFIIRVSFLEHPLFQELLDWAEEEYECTYGSKLCIPCDENIFIDIIRWVRRQTQ